MKFDLVCSDCPWSFSDRLKMSDVKRGAEANYSTLTTNQLKELPIKDICNPNSLLALWVPSSLLQDGLDVMKAWEFEQKQTWIWVKEKKNASGDNPNEELQFGMGRLWRNVHELVLIGTRGSVYEKLQNHSQRTVFYEPSKKHSEKPEALQDQLDIMFPDISLNRLEMFARRQRKGWHCVGNEVSGSEILGEDIRDSIQRLILL